jgi:hypothetical protein
MLGRRDQKHNCEGYTLQLLKKSNMRYGEEEKREFADFQKKRSTLVEPFMKRVEPNFHWKTGSKRTTLIDPPEHAPKRGRFTQPTKSGDANLGKPTQDQATTSRNLPMGKPKENPAATEILPVPSKTTEDQSSETQLNGKSQQTKKAFKSKSIISSVSSSSSSSSSSTSSSSACSKTSSVTKQKDVLSLHPEENSTYTVSVPKDTPEYVPTDPLTVKLKVLNDQQTGRVLLNVGGRKFESSELTLSGDPSSILAGMIRPDSPVKPVRNEYFIDRNPRYFDFVLDYLRSPDAFPRILPSDVTALRQIHVEAKFYGLSGLVRAVESKSRARETLWEDSEQ